MKISFILSIEITLNRPNNLAEKVACLNTAAERGRTAGDSHRSGGFRPLPVPFHSFCPQSGHRQRASGPGGSSGQDPGKDHERAAMDREYLASILAGCGIS